MTPALNFSVNTLNQQNLSCLVSLDDPFSAVDGSTGNWIFEHGILQSLKHTLRVVALNSHRQLLHRFDRVVILEHGMVVADGHPSELAVTHRDVLFGTSLAVSGKEEESRNRNGESSTQRTPPRLRVNGLSSVPASLFIPKITTSDKNKKVSSDLAPASTSTAASVCSLGEIKVVMEPADSGVDDEHGASELPENDESKALDVSLEDLNAGGDDTEGVVVNAFANTANSTGVARADMTKIPGSSSSGVVEPGGGFYIPVPTSISTIDQPSDERNLDGSNSNHCNNNDSDNESDKDNNHKNNSSNNNNNSRGNSSQRTTRINRVVKQLVVTEARKAGGVSLAVYSKYFAAAMKKDIMESNSSSMYTMDSEAGTTNSLTLTLTLTTTYIESSNTTD